MTDRDTAIAVRDRIGRLYGYTGPYGTTEPSTVETVEEIQQVEIQINEEERTEMIFNRFKKDSVAGRILAALAGGPKTPAQLAHLAKVRSESNLMGAGGWYYQLRKFGKTSGKFKLVKEENRLVLTINKRYVGQV